MDILKQFNLSYSAYNTYKTSPLQFYFQYIKKANPTDKGFQVYGDAGNVVHESIEEYIKTGKDIFHETWVKYDIDNQTGMRGVKLSYNNYKQMFENAKQICCNFSGKVEVEKEIQVQIHGMNIKAFLDIYIEAEPYVFIYDWKTNTSGDAEKHKSQRLFYSWLIWKTQGKFSHTKWFYLACDKVFADFFNDVNLTIFDQEIQAFINTIQIKGDDINNYPAGQWDNPFNNYFTLCKEEVQRREQKAEIVAVEIKGSYAFITGTVDPVIINVFDSENKFDLPNKYWMQKKIREKKQGYVDLENVGTIHLFNSRHRYFPVGMIDKFKECIKFYNEFYKKNVVVEIKDHRQQPLIYEHEFLPSPRKARDYQIEAKEIFIQKKTGVIALATGLGKTFIATEIIRELKHANVLWLCDKTKLKEQTIDSIRENLGYYCGEIGDNNLQIKNIVVATVQTIASYINPEGKKQSLIKRMMKKAWEEYKKDLPNDLSEKELEKIKTEFYKNHTISYEVAYAKWLEDNKFMINYLSTISFVIIDEYHNSACETYQKVLAKLPNAVYRLGLSATPQRDDGKTPMLFAHIGEIIYQKSAEWGIEQGYLVKPNIQFIKLEEGLVEEDETYPVDYKENIVNNNQRNNKIVSIVCDALGDLKGREKIVIITKQVEHGKVLCDSVNYNGITCRHIHGEAPNRTQDYYDFIDNKYNVIVMTVSIGGEGLDIPNLTMGINAAANKGDNRSIQFIGRILRLSEGKKAAKYIDFIDRGIHTRKHSIKRMQAFNKQGYEVEIIE
jgi:superfamily II DNA or RNA helicase